MTKQYYRNANGCVVAFSSVSCLDLPATPCLPHSLWLVVRFVLSGVRHGRWTATRLMLSRAGRRRWKMWVQLSGPDKHLLVRRSCT